MAGRTDVSGDGLPAPPPPTSPTPVHAPRPASTVMVVRDGSDPVAPLEVLMLRRNVRSEFVGGAHVFPGGAVDSADGGAAAAELCTGDDAAASAVLGVDGGGLAYWVAAVRECFEEAGILLAVPRHGGHLPLAGPDDAARFVAHRQALNDGTLSFAGLCRREGLRVPVDRIHYFAHWITPEGLPRRYDTRFFVTAAPPGQVPAHDAAETVADVWIRPADALARHRAGEMELILPTIRNLQAIGRFPTAAAVLGVAAGVRRVPSVTPRMVVDSEGLRLLLPGDPGYDELLPAPPSSLQDAAAATRAASARANMANVPDALPAEPDALPPERRDAGKDVR
jgi:8-oxo-dGTP pyrophosphatase MutT (NUDIX family)